MQPAKSLHQHRPLGRTQGPSGSLLAVIVVIAMLGIAGAATARAATLTAEISQAQQLVRDGEYEKAYQLLLPIETQGENDATFNALLGEAALRTNRADQAVTWFRRSLEANPDSVDAHLGLARAYLAMGNYASAKIEFETVLRIDDLPPDLHQQVEIYAKAAQDYAAGKRLVLSGYVITGYGNYSVNATDGTDEFGGSDTDDNFVALRGGGRANYRLNDDYALNGSLDYRFRDYHDNDDRRDDKDLRWNGAVNRSMGDDNLVVGLRGRRSYRGDGDYRDDYGIYSDWRHAFSTIDQFNVEFEFRRRDYPSGRLRERSRNIAELTAGWTRSLFGGKASFNLQAFGGREFATDDRPDGDSNFYGMMPELSFTITEAVGGFVFGWWQRDRYNIERINVDAADNILGIGEREEDLYEAGGGLTWEFADSWSLNPEILYIYDDSNFLANEYSSTEIWMTIRKDF